MSKVIIPDLDGFNLKKAKFKRDGSTNLHIVADFDKTLTPAFVHEQKIRTSYSLLRDGGYLTPDYPKRAYAEFDKYHPYEADAAIPLEIRKKKMQEWWRNHWGILIECGMNKGVIKDILNKNKVVFRDGAEYFFKILEKNKIPLLIFSSGLGDLIQEFLKHKQLITFNVHIISNFFIFNDQGIAVDYQKPLIDVFRKNELEIKSTSYHQEIKQRKNLILLGDHIGDLGMSEGLVHDEIINIGFLNGDKNKLKVFSENFDLIIVEDDSMDYVNKFLEELINFSPR